MADDKGIFGKQVTRGESLIQVVVMLVVLLGISQFTHALSGAQNTDNPKSASVTEASLRGETGPMGATGPQGEDGSGGEAGADGATGATGVQGLMGLRGYSGARGPAGADGDNELPGTLVTAYGQLSASSSGISFSDADEWVDVPFSTEGPSSNMTVSTDSPATITVEQDGACQVSTNIYFSAETSDEDTFTQTTYTLGIKVNDAAVTPVAAAYASNPGDFMLNYSSILDLDEGDTVQFYMKASVTDFPPFSNLVNIENADAYLMQISN